MFMGTEAWHGSFRNHAIVDVRKGPGIDRNP